MEKIEQTIEELEDDKRAAKKKIQELDQGIQTKIKEKYDILRNSSTNNLYFIIYFQ